MKLIVKIATALVALLLSTGAAAATLADIISAGKIVVGVKQDYRPWGYLDAQGNIIGLEIDLAKDVAEQLGVGLELVPVVASNRMEFLQQGRIDLIIATMGDNKKRRKVVGMIEPNYYAGGANVIAPRGSGLSAWADLDGKTVCAIQGSYYNKAVSRNYGAKMAAFAGVAEATAALVNGNCVALVYDNTWIESQLATEPQWAAYEMPFVTEQLQPWAIAVPLAALDKDYGDKMREIVTGWHKSGFLIERNRANGIADNPFQQEQHDSLQ